MIIKFEGHIFHVNSGSLQSKCPGFLSSHPSLGSDGYLISSHVSLQSVNGFVRYLTEGNLNLSDFQQHILLEEGELCDEFGCKELRRLLRTEYDRRLSELEHTMLALRQSIDEIKGELKSQTNKFVYVGPLNGIIRNLTRECGGNVIDKRVIDPIYSSFLGGCHPRNIVDFDNSNSYFCSNNEPNSYVGYDFKEKRIKPNSYTLRTWNYGPGSYHLKSWVIETSNDNSNWRVIHRVENNSDLNGNLKMKNFSISESDICRMIRLRQTGENHLCPLLSGYRRCLFVNAFEIYGEIIY